MAVSTWFCRLPKKKSCFLFGIGIMTLTLLVYHFYVTKDILGNIYYRLASSNYSLLSFYQHASGGLGISEVLWPPNDPDILENPSCSTDQKKINLTSCSGCLRPAVAQFVNNTFYEIGIRDGLKSNQSDGYFKARQKIVQNLATDYLIVPQFNSSNAFLLAVQPSLLDRRYERETVRNTWASVARHQTWPNRKINANVKVVFVVAKQIITNPGKNSTQQFQEIRSEADQFNDILYIDMIDSYENLTLKTVSTFKWVKDYCPCVKFVLKVDYDTFVNVPLLVDTLLYFEDRFENSILGNVYTSNKVRRWGKWAVPSSLYPLDTYVPHASGCGYVMSYKVLSQIVDTTPYVPMFSIEDAFITGVMRVIIRCRMFSGPELFTHRDQRNWYRCLMHQDKKILGTSKDGGRRHYWVWSTFAKGWCK